MEYEPGMLIVTEMGSPGGCLIYVGVKIFW